MMNKKQWIALSILFMIFAIIFAMFSISWGDNALQWRLATEMGENATIALAGTIVSAVHDAVYTILACLCFIAMFACWICGWLEKEEAT
ncbi:MAG TPA: hypothetical protein C5S37_14805 [Methanophagales archaeon]|nr:hypothetical protein [Methanophagales archaeon]